MTDNKIKHLEFIQAVITRKNSNSFFIKGWSISIIAALFVLGADDFDEKYLMIALFTTIMFWILDGFFLSQERKFRALYNNIRTIKEEKIDFSMNTNQAKPNTRNSWFRSLFSYTLFLFYGFMIALLWLINYFLCSLSS